MEFYLKKKYVLICIILILQLFALEFKSMSKTTKVFSNYYIFRLVRLNLIQLIRFKIHLHRPL